MAQLRLFGRAAEAAGTSRDEIAADTVSGVLSAASSRYGDEFAKVAATCRVWVNGDDANPDARVGPDDEVALLPPVSGG
ncbi:MAG: MoaD/ThiS family protein [Acidimicrobiales bacterium]